jgi:hypothetical protein
MHSFQGFSRDFVWNELSMVEGWGYFQWAINNDPIRRIMGGEKTGTSYCQQEKIRLIEQAIKADPNWQCQN